MKIGFLLRERARWLRAPGALLMVLLQRTPAVNVTVAVEQVIVGSPIGVLLRSAAAVAALGAVNTMAGATPLVPSSGNASGITVNAGSTVSVFYTVNGTQTPPMSWHVSGNVPPGLNFSGLTSDGSVNVGSLHLAGTPTTGGSYVVSLQTFEFANEGGEGSPIYNYTITVNGGVANSPPSFSTHPSSQTVTVGASVMFNSAASGTPGPTFQWRKNNVDIGGATSSSFTINGVTEGDAGSYTVVATNSQGSVTSNAATLTVSAVLSAPSFTAQPTSQSVTAGGPVTFSAAANGNPTPTYQWRKNGNNIGGATNSSYSIGSVSAGDAGDYTVVASNSQGSATSNIASLTVGSVGPALSAPVITLQPASQIVTIGGTVSFTTSAEGNPAPTLQWRKNGIAIGGATGTSLVIASATLGDAGDYSVVATNSQGTATSNSANLTVQSAKNTDFNGDGHPDILWQNTTTGERYLWFMNGTTHVGDASLGIVPTEWSIAATADFNGDGHPDILWQNTTTGERALWFMNGATNTGFASLGLVPTEWSIAASSDFNGDGHPDILWQNTTTGERALWFMNGATNTGFASLGLVPTEWSIAASADFNGDSHPDILWQNTTTGERALWFMNGATNTGFASLGLVPTEWSIAASSDFNGDGHPDILWQNTTTGERALWFMNGATNTGFASLGIVPTEWSIAGSPRAMVVPKTYPLDFNGDGRPDILWQNTTTGERYLWFMNGTTHVGDASLGIVPTEWSIAATADFNGDGHPDILWQNTTTGERALWFMNGATNTGFASLGLVPTEWSIAATADFNSDGHPDILWQNTTTGERALWFMNGATNTGFASLGLVPTEWSIAATADFNGDGHPDILWQNTTTGERALWFMNGATNTGFASLGLVPTEWSIAATADFNGDGHPDILWQNTTTGERALWFMNGATNTGFASLGLVPIEWSMKD